MLWHYAENNQEKGPVDERSIAQLIASGALSRHTLVWRPGLSAWTPAAETELQRYFATSVARPAAHPVGHYEAPTVYAAPAAPIGGVASAPIRSPAIAVLLSIVTLGIYGLYLIYAWAKETNDVVGREAFRPRTVVLLSIVTCTAATVVYECLYAFEIERAARDQGIVSATRGFGALIVALNVAHIVLFVLSGGLLSIITYGAIIALMQAELNKFATDD